MTGPTKAVLLVEDETELRGLFKLLLEAEQLEVLEAGDGGEALRILEERNEAIGVIVTDMNLPGVDGPAIVAHARTRFPSIRILAMSGYGGADMLMTAADSKVDGFINKPFDPPTAIAAVRRLLGGA
jgi:two-component system, cell cycle sensor histidine kinase and response regulator CckA